MRICDVPWASLRVGQRIRSLKSGGLGVIDALDLDDDAYIWVRWDGEDQAYGGNYHHMFTTCELLLDKKEETG